MNDEISQEETSQKEISPCSSISVQPNKFSNPEILTAGEDGKINLFYVLEKGVTNPKTCNFLFPFFFFPFSSFFNPRK